MDCPSCSAVDAIIDGRCRWCHFVAGSPCPKCRAIVAKGEELCTACGYEVKSRRRLLAEKEERAQIRMKIGWARVWLLVVAILSFVAVIVTYPQQREAVEEQIKLAESQVRTLTPAQRDAVTMKTLGVTWDEAVARDRRVVTLTLAVNVAIAFIFGGLWFWAKRNALVATLAALTLFAIFAVVNLILAPESVTRGWIVRAAVAVTLLKAVFAAMQERRMGGTSR